MRLRDISLVEHCVILTLFYIVVFGEDYDVIPIYARTGTREHGVSGGLANLEVANPGVRLKEVLLQGSL